MDRAKYKDAVGKHRTVTAEELEKQNIPTTSLNDKVFICIECGEYVTFVRRDKYRSYFTHGDKKEDKKECTLRVELKENCSIYEKAGLPLYLKESSPGNFELYMGFYDIGDALLKRAEKERWKVTIRGLKGKRITNNIYYINHNNFLTDSTTLKKIDFISKQYKLEYNSMDSEKILGPRWGYDIEGILDEGALFTYTTYGGQKIRINDEITTHTEYFYLCKDRYISDYFSEIEHEYCGELFSEVGFLKSMYHVYKIVFQPKDSEEFDNLYKFCRKYLKVSLLYKPSTLIPMWPPVIKRDNEISFLEQGNKALFVLETIEEDANVFIHGNTYNSSDELERKKIGTHKYLITMPAVTSRRAINISTNYNSIYMFVNKYKDSIKTYSNIMNVRDKHGIPIDRGSYFRLPQDGQLQVIADSRCNILHFKRAQIHKTYTITDSNGVSIDDISFGDEIIAIYGVRNNFLVKYLKRKGQGIDVFDDELLYLTLYKLDGPFMAPPIWLKKLLMSLKGESKTASIIKHFLVSNKMPIAANKILKEIYINGEDADGKDRYKF